MTFWGQWVGKCNILVDPGGATNRSNDLILNIDQRSPNIGKLGCFDPHTPSLSFWADIQIDSKDPYWKAKINNFTIVYPNPGQPQPQYQVIHPNSGDVETHYKDGKGGYQGRWKTNISEGTFELERLASEEIKPDKTFTKWTEFIDWISENSEGRNFIFRGHDNNSFDLQTSYHRLERFDLIDYHNNIVPVLGRYVTGILNRSFDLQNNPIEYGALLNLAQHHGFPTPLLDWTESPYIAVFFAYNKLEKSNSEGSVRLFVFDRASWDRDEPYRPNLLLHPSPFLTVLDLLPINNPRALPQQSILTATNVANIESWLKKKERERQSKYLWRFDLPVAERKKVMKELYHMGITSASMFPGLDGMCQALKEKYF